MNSERLQIPMVYKQTPSKLVNLRVIVNAGSMRETPEQYGVAHFLEHMFFKGTTRRSYKEINALASSLGDANAYTSQERTVYHLTCLESDFEQALALLAEMVFEPSFPEEELQREIGVILEEHQMRIDNPQCYFADELYANLLGEAGHKTIGTREAISSMTVDRLREFRRQWYVGNRMAIGVFGNVEYARAAAAVRDLIPSLEWTLAESLEQQTNMEDFHFHHASKQAMMELVYPGVSLKHEYDFDHLPDVLGNGIGGGLHSLLADRLREELGLCYWTSAAHYSYDKIGQFHNFVALDKTNIPQAIEEIQAILARVCESGFSDDLLAIAKRNYLFGVGRRLESSSGTGGLADCAFALDPQTIAPYLDFETRKRQVESITNDHVIEFARLLFHNVTPKIVTMTPDA